ncbi:NAD-dependent epimerase/dehydratase family protein [Amycolatopsis anabasis]|uniref:NAD-dependent epimerase/dehydratase family protein n=1 Tax=Amycolatopsis anabasis TaxID=1840409 RepID=UPI00131B1451|nr:NAD-dependent epimerase/dehydratase family protein [Amycolatopsis anabasis]
MVTHVLVTGGSGFIGSAVVRALTAGHKNHANVSALVRTRNSPAGVRALRADLTVPETVAGVCAGVDTVVHAASYVGDDTALCTAVNDEGTATLVREATRAGVRRIIYVSTAAVYGHRAQVGHSPDQLELRPESAASRSRAAAEEHVLAAGGIVVRPHVVYGRGDRWVVPSLIRLRRLLDGWPETSAQVSLIAAEELGRLLAGLAMVQARSVPSQAILHATHPIPIPVATVFDLVGRAFGLDPPRRSVPIARARDVLADRGGAAAVRRLAMYTDDHVYDSERIWQITGCRPGPGFPGDLPELVGWYREHIAGEP